MKKASRKKNDSEMLMEYDFSKGVRGRYSKRYAEGSNAVVSPPVASRRELMQQLSALRDKLREHGIRDAPDYAEVLVAEALSSRTALMLRRIFTILARN
jgi:hypothetical protein